MTLQELERLVAPEYVVNTDSYESDVLWVVQSPACHPGRSVHGGGIHNDNGGYCYSDIYFCVMLDGDRIVHGCGDGYHRDFHRSRTISPSRLKARLNRFYLAYQDNDTRIVNQISREALDE
jgi:hypothetical protein